ncbi:TadE family protein [Nocardioides sp.]|uniref:TadE family protein n=1 Tax=Nocardioides sp. TaxID=35761 RepID=UPI002C4F29D2|nr:TadE family protein [Nocardioides sp.]HXH78401.1 TadE family protein [Nocardioides sp.]
MTRLEERGSITIWMATTSVAMTLMVGLAVDLGGQVHAQQRAHDLAAQAARAGGERVQAAPAIEGDYVRIDALEARNAATEYLSAAHVSGTVTVTDGTTLTVHVTDSYNPRFLGVLGINHLPVSGNASARLVRSLGGNER